MNRIKTLKKQVKHQIARTGVLGKDFKVKQAKKLGQVNGTDKKAIEKANKKIQESIQSRSSLDHNQFGTDTLKALVQFHTRNLETLALVREALAQKKTFQKELFTSLQTPNKQNSRAFNKSTQEHNRKAIEDSSSLLGVSMQDIQDENIPAFQSKLAEATKLSNPSISTNSRVKALEIRKERMREPNTPYMAMRAHFHAAYDFSKGSIRSLEALNTIKFSNNPDAIKARQEYADNVYNIRDVQQGTDLDHLLHLYSSGNKIQFNLARKKLVQNLSQEDIQKLAPESISAFDTLGTKDAAEVVFDKKQIGQRQIFAEYYRLNNEETIDTETDLKLKILDAKDVDQFAIEKTRLLAFKRNLKRFESDFPRTEESLVSQDDLSFDKKTILPNRDIKEVGDQPSSGSDVGLAFDIEEAKKKENLKRFESDFPRTEESLVSQDDLFFDKKTILPNRDIKEVGDQPSSGSDVGLAFDIEEAKHKKEAATTIQDQWKTFKTRKTFNEYIGAQKKADELRSQLQGSIDAPSFDKEHIQKISDIIASSDYKTNHPDDHLADLTPQQILTLGKALHQLKVISEDNVILGTIVDLAIKNNLSDSDLSTLSELSGKDKVSIQKGIKESRSILSKESVSTIDNRGYNTYSEAYDLYSQVVLGKNKPTLNSDNITSQLLRAVESMAISNPQDVQTIKEKIDSGEEVKIENLSDKFKKDLIDALEKGNPSMSKEQVNDVYTSFMQSDSANYLDLDTGTSTSGIQANESYKEAISPPR